MKAPTVVLITGASSGIGRAIAVELVRRGYRVFGTSRSTATAVPQGVELLQLEVTSDDSARACVEAVLARAGRLDVLINNAGAMLFGAAEEVSSAELVAHLDLNLVGTARMVQAALPSMRAQRSGTIINLGSLGGVSGLPYLSAYSASKFALAGYSEALRLELLPLGIYVALVEPGGAHTESLARSQRRVAMVLPAYADAAGQALARMRAAQERGGLAPESVARVVAGISARRRPPFRHLVGGQAVGVMLAKRLLPQRLYEAIVLRQFRPAHLR